jgi:hypothetical protein
VSRTEWQERLIGKRFSQAIGDMHRIKVKVVSAFVDVDYEIGCVTVRSFTKLFEAKLTISGQTIPEFQTTNNTQDRSQNEEYVSKHLNTQVS